MWPLRSPESRSDGLAGPEWHSPPALPSQPLRWLFFWGGLFGLIGLFDLWRNTKRDGSTLTETVRYAFATDTPQGQAAFELSLRVIHRHILKQ